MSLLADLSSILGVDSGWESCFVSVICARPLGHDKTTGKLIYEFARSIDFRYLHDQTAEAVVLRMQEHGAKFVSDKDVEGLTRYLLIDVADISLWSTSTYINHIPRIIYPRGVKCL